MNRTDLQKMIANGGLSGEPADRLLAANGDVNVLRPYIGNDGRSYVTHVSPMGLVENQCLSNATATMRKDDWLLLDGAVVAASTQRLKLANYLKSKGLTFTIPQGMGKTILETETQSEVNDAAVSMDGLRESENDRPEYNTGSLPLPITYKDFQYSARQILVSRNGGSPLDTTTVDVSARKVAESVEKFVLGRNATYTFGGASAYGLLNFPSRITRTITSPAAVGWTGTTLLNDVIALRQDSVNTGYHYGPWALFVAPNWDTYLDADFKTQSDRTLRERLESINGIAEITTLDYMQNYDMILVELQSNVIRLVIGMDITVVQWDTNGGMKKNFKIMTIVVPQVRADFNSRTGIVHGSV